jgi:hypothetical protein
MDIRLIGRLLLLLGLVFALVGALIVVLGKLPYLGKLPGDIDIQRRGFSIYFPLTTCLLLSILVTILMWIFLKK